MKSYTLHFDVISYPFDCSFFLLEEMKWNMVACSCKYYDTIIEIVGLSPLWEGVLIAGPCILTNIRKKLSRQQKCSEMWKCTRHEDEWNVLELLWLGRKQMTGDMIEEGKNNE